jgi:SOS response regulatory protein OraA/RecX
MRFARAFVHDARLRRVLGHRLLRLELRRKGVAEAAICGVLEEAAPPEQERALALAAASKLLGRYRASRKKTLPASQQARIAQFLGRRGFDWGTIRAVIRRLFPTEGSQEQAAGSIEDGTDF